MPIAIIEIDNPEHLLVWPIEIAAGEIDRWLRFGSAKGYRGQEWASAVTTVLTAAFSGPALVQEFEAQERSITYQSWWPLRGRRPCEKMGVWACPPTPSRFWLLRPCISLAPGPLLKGRALSLRARRSDFRFPTGPPGRPTHATYPM